MSTRREFVQVKGARDVPAKLSLLDAGRADIEYFESPTGPTVRREQVSFESVREIELSSQTRVFWFDNGANAWRVGRVDGGLISAQALKASEDHYAVRFPNGLGAYLPI